MAETNSTKLLLAIKQNDLDIFQATLKDASRDEINKFHGFPHDWTCLQCAIHRGRMPFIEALLHAGAEVNDFNPVRKVSSIHLAVKNGLPESLEILLYYGANVNGREGEGRTALHVLIGQWNRDGMENVRWRYFELLVSQPSIDVNAQDNMESTPLELAVRKNLESVARKLLQAGAVINEHDKMPDLLAEYPEEEVPDNNVVEITSDYLEAELWKALRNGHYERFQQLLNQVQAGGFGSIVNLSTSSSDHNPTLLQHACETEATSAVAALLAAGVDPNQTSNKSSIPPLVEASMRGNLEIIQLLAHIENITIDVVNETAQTALHKVAQNLHKANSTEDKLRYSQCLQELLSSGSARPGAARINVNAQDVFGNTALHYAALSGVEEAVLQLLHHGAHLGVKNILNETAMKWILPSTLESFLDSYISIQNTEHSAVKFDYAILAPSRRLENSRQQAQTSSSSQAQNDDAAVESICLNIIPEVENIDAEFEILKYLSNSKRHQYLLKHPVITSFLELKWHNIRFFYYINVLIYTLAVIVPTTYILLLHSGYNADSTKVPLDILWWCLLIFVTILFAREMFQLGIAPFRYLFSPENYIELIMLVCTSVVLAYSDDAASRRSITAMAVLLAWGVGFFLLGRHPNLSIFVTMFTTVSMRFIRLLMFYSILIIGFGLSFFLVFRPAPSSDDDKKESAFDSVPASLLKVFVMMTGELEFGNPPFGTNPIMSRWESRLIFGAFLFLITIVLFSLMTGIALDDTQSVRSNVSAETYKYLHLTELIDYMEWIALKLHNCCPCLWQNPIVLFYACTKDNKLTVLLRKETYQFSWNNCSSWVKRFCPWQRDFRPNEEIIQNAVQRAWKIKK